MLPLMGHKEPTCYRSFILIGCGEKSERKYYITLLVILISLKLQKSIVIFL